MATLSPAGAEDPKPGQFVTLDFCVLQQGEHPMKTVELEPGATVADVLKEVAKHKGVSASKLFIAVQGYTGKVKLYPHEVPNCEFRVGGVSDLQGVPMRLRVPACKKGGEISLEDAVKIQYSLIEAYTEPGFRRMLAQYQAKFLSGERDLKDYNKNLGDILRPSQQRVMPKYGFPATQKGVFMMNDAFDKFENQPEVAARAAIVNNLIGIDYAWLPETMRRMMGFSAAES